jgi:hypothetical protein
VPFHIARIGDVNNPLKLYNCDMKTIWIFSTVVIAGSALGQGAFQNLDFESAQVIPVSTNANGSVNIATANALPGWSAFAGANQLSLIPYNSQAEAAWPVVGLYGSNVTVIGGNFEVMLTSGGSISQTGLVPANAESLLFGAAFIASPPFVVSLDGQNLSYEVISNALNSQGYSYTIYGADISAFVGQVETLAFSAPGYGILDNIQFSPITIPEPSAISLICLGSGVLFYVRRRRHHSP